MSESGEKTFAPSEKRLRDAARKGDVLRSRELSTAAIVLLGAGWLSLAGPWLMAQLSDLLRAGFTFDRDEIGHFAPGAMLLDGLMVALPPIATIAVPVMLLALVTQLTADADAVDAVGSKQGRNRNQAKQAIPGKAAVTLDGIVHANFPFAGPPIQGPLSGFCN